LSPLVGLSKKQGKTSGSDRPAGSRKPQARRRK